MEEQKKIIFLVDDNPIYLNVGKTSLQDKYTVVTMPSGEKLLEVLDHAKPDLILLDIEMPGLSGYETIEKLKSNKDTMDIPVIFLTGKSEAENELQGLSLGAVDYISKPFSPPLLLLRIELHLTMQDQKNELKKFNENLSEMVAERTNDINQLQNAIILWAAEMVEFRDQETGQHVERVQQYIKLLLGAMLESETFKEEASSWDADALYKSAALHDVGKIKIPDEILLKKSRLTEEEFTIMKSHALDGKLLIESLEDKVPNETFLSYAKIFSYLHHERWDGKGYPDGRKGFDIPLHARMMSFADVYDALVTERPYKKAFTHEEAMKIIEEGRGSQFDPELTDLFLSLSSELKEISTRRVVN